MFATRWQHSAPRSPAVGLQLRPSSMYVSNSGPRAKYGPQCNSIWSTRKSKIMPSTGPLVIYSTNTANTTSPRMLCWTIRTGGSFIDVYATLFVFFSFIFNNNDKYITTWWKMVTVEIYIWRLHFTFYLLWCVFMIWNFARFCEIWSDLLNIIKL